MIHCRPNASSGFICNTTAGIPCLPVCANHEVLAKPARAWSCEGFSSHRREAERSTLSYEIRVADGRFSHLASRVEFVHFAIGQSFVEPWSLARNVVECSGFKPTPTHRRCMHQQVLTTPSGSRMRIHFEHIPNRLLTN